MSEKLKEKIATTPNDKIFSIKFKGAEKNMVVSLTDSEYNRLKDPTAQLITGLRHNTHTGTNKVFWFNVSSVEFMEQYEQGNPLY